MEVSRGQTKVGKGLPGLGGKVWCKAEQLLRGQKRVQKGFNLQGYTICNWKARELFIITFPLNLPTKSVLLSDAGKGQTLKVFRATHVTVTMTTYQTGILATTPMNEF